MGTMRAIRVEMYKIYSKIYHCLPFLLSLPNEMGILIVFDPFFFLLFYVVLISFYFPCVFSVNTGWIVLKFNWENDRYGYEVVQEGFEIENGGLGGSLGGMPNSAQIMSGQVLGNYIGGLVLCFILFTI